MCFLHGGDYSSTSDSWLDMAVSDVVTEETKEMPGTCLFLFPLVYIYIYICWEKNLKGYFTGSETKQSIMLLVLKNVKKKEQ